MSTFPVRRVHVVPENVLREISKTGQNRNQRTPAKVPKRGQQQIRIDLFLRVRVEFLLQRNIYEIEKVEQPNPGYAGDEVQPAQSDM